MYETGDWKMYTMMQVCKEANMTYQTLKYYCNKGFMYAGRVYDSSKERNVY